MKRLILCLILNMSLITLNAQYIKMPLDTNHYWYEYCADVQPPGAASTYMLRVKKDSIVNGINYKLLSVGGSSCLPQNFYPILLRQDTILKRVIILHNNQESILYNFNKNIGDTAKLFCVNGVTTKTLTSKDSVLLNDGIYHKRFAFGGTGPGNIIEGVGSKSGLLFPMCNTFNTSRGLICLVKSISATAIYSNAQSSLSCSIPVDVQTYDLSSKHLNIFPNPSSNIINISADNWVPEIVELINCTGESLLVIRDWKETNGVIDISALPCGIYLVRCKSGFHVNNRLLIKN